jgi:hypothetical protein
VPTLSFHTLNSCSAVVSLVAWRSVGWAVWCWNASNSGVPRNFLSRKGGKGVKQIQLRTEQRDLEAVDPYSGVPLSLQMSETLILIRLLQMYFPRNGEFGSALSKLRNFGGGDLNPPPSPWYATASDWCFLQNVFIMSGPLILLFTVWVPALIYHGDKAASA